MEGGSGGVSSPSSVCLVPGQVERKFAIVHIHVTRCLRGCLYQLDTYDSPVLKLKIILSCISIALLSLKCHIAELVR